ncbi:hypothetical protein NDU88_012632 [Pleurodeles waltl]|uniref:Uncharacterized protein n=1 Tax=Pleurodeles waltl TaxID=8319 RepID=A0AAV7R274_PLEWA|nr:hypothetical protein NDU88_012632 [Pleurodeles waltl]
MLLSYRITPHSVTRKTPFELLRGRKPSSRLIPWWLKNKKQRNLDGNYFSDVREQVHEHQGKVLRRVNNRKTMLRLVAGQYVRVKNHGLIHKRGARWSRPVNVVKVFDGAVQLEDGRTRNLRHLSLFKACSIPEGKGYEDLDEANGYLWGDNSILQSDELRSDGVDERESRYHGNSTIPIRKSQRAQKLPGHFNEFVMG